MRKVEIVTIVISLVTFLLKIFTPFGLDRVFFLSTAVVVWGYLLFGFFVVNNIPVAGLFKKVSYQNLSIRRIVGSIFVGFALSAPALGIVFKGLHMEGSTQMFMIGIEAMFALMAVSFVRYLFTKSEFHRDNIFRSIVWLAFSLLVVLLS